MNIKKYAIVIPFHDVSERAFEVLNKSANGSVFRFDAVTPSSVVREMKQAGVEWNWPWERSEIDLVSGMLKIPYPTRDRNARMACSMSHYILWKHCIKLNRPIMILEHDAVFIKDIDALDIEETALNIIGVNDPRGATRLSKKYYDMVKACPNEFNLVPLVDDNINIPMGLAGNSAYIIKPEGARSLIKAVKEYGMWPNDAIMCRQLIPKVGVTKTFYTTIQRNLRSTTT